ncbi:unnamed protein product [Heligmosomoides polygyrus]|uniref:ANK_REP_REGION domain-containing protein n=1 Tax=Heligmosomoides polygyrus TaxID=6339 RepID=A0A3P8BB02_HELPZ|nr:unnamed protein product [Heligmosomoides polygyrus]
MFRLAMESGARLNIANKQNLTPLTLAAKLAKKQMFMEILELEGDSVWAYGGAASTAYPLSKIDTINEVTGELNEASALSLVVYGETTEHLDLLDGLLETVLEAKWQAFGKRSMLRSLAAFTFYYIFVVLAFALRPISMSTAVSQITWGWITFKGSPIDGPYYKGEVPEIPTAEGVMPYRTTMTQCHLRDYWDPNLSIWNGWVRLAAEAVVLLCVFIQLVFEIKDVKRIGRGKWWTIHVSSHRPFSWSLRAVKFVGPFVLMVYTIIATDIRRFLMIYGIFLIGFSQAFYLVFLSCEREETNSHPSTMDQDRFQNVIQTPFEAFIRTFILTIGEFTVLYRNLAMCPAAVMVWIGKVISRPAVMSLSPNVLAMPLLHILGIQAQKKKSRSRLNNENQRKLQAVFLIFELGVSILQFNLLIAMMTRTYETIFRTRKEYKRQWAQVILMLELSLAPNDRLMYLLQYSRPTGTNKKVRSFVVNKYAHVSTF